MHDVKQGESLENEAKSTMAGAPKHKRGVAFTPHLRRGPSKEGLRCGKGKRYLAERKKREKEEERGFKSSDPIR